MTKLRTNASPTQMKKYIAYREKQGKMADPAYLAMFKTAEEHKRETEADPEWAKDNLEYDLRTSDMIAEKCQDDSYAQNLYAALCNMRWQRIEVMNILKDQYWSCTWRYAGGLIADILERGDYMDWYCSGIGGGDEPDTYNAGHDLARKGYVAEGHVTEEIKADLASLGWQPVEWADKD
jgi:hypothetical protein